MRQKPSAYLRKRAEAIYNGQELPHALDIDWFPYVWLTMPETNDIGGPAWSKYRDAEMRSLRCCLAAAIAEADGR